MSDRPIYTPVSGLNRYRRKQRPGYKDPRYEPGYTSDLSKLYPEPLTQPHR